MKFDFKWKYLLCFIIAYTAFLLGGAALFYGFLYLSILSRGIVVIVTTSIIWCLKTTENQKFTWLSANKNRKTLFVVQWRICPRPDPPSKTSYILRQKHISPFLAHSRRYPVCLTCMSPVLAHHLIIHIIIQFANLYFPSPGAPPKKTYPFHAGAMQNWSD